MKTADSSASTSPVPPSGARALVHIYRLGRRYSLGRNKQYTYVYRRGKSFPGYRMVLVYLKARDLKVGFSVSSKVGNAVTRNRLRRRMKEDFRMLRHTLKPGKYIFVARSAAVSAEPVAMAREMRSLLKRAQLFDAPEAMGDA